jgi:hypothetical protein
VDANGKGRFVGVTRRVRSAPPLNFTLQRNGT